MNIEREEESGIFEANTKRQCLVLPVRHSTEKEGGEGGNQLRNFFMLTAVIETKIIRVRTLVEW